MNLILQKQLDVVDDNMKRHNPKDIDMRNIKESISLLKNDYPQDQLEIEEWFLGACKRHGYDYADFTSAKNA